MKSHFSKKSSSKGRSSGRRHSSAGSRLASRAFNSIRRIKSSKGYKTSSKKSSKKGRRNNKSSKKGRRNNKNIKKKGLFDKVGDWWDGCKKKASDFKESVCEKAVETKNYVVNKAKSAATTVKTWGKNIVKNARTFAGKVKVAAKKSARHVCSSVKRVASGAGKIIKTHGKDFAKSFKGSYFNSMMKTLGRGFNIKSNKDLLVMIGVTALAVGVGAVATVLLPGIGGMMLAGALSGGLNDGLMQLYADRNKSASVKLKNFLYATGEGALIGAVTGAGGKAISVFDKMKTFKPIKEGIKIAGETAVDYLDDGLHAYLKSKRSKLDKNDGMKRERMEPYLLINTIT